MLAYQLHRHFPAPFEGDVDELGARGFFHTHGQNLVFLFRAGTAHFHFVGTSGLDGFQILFGGFVGRFCIHPQHKLV